MSGTGYILLIVMSILITIVFYLGLRMKGPWGSYWTFFIVILFAVFATELWVKPAGPYHGGIYWLPPLVIGLLTAILLVAVTPKPTNRDNLAKQKEDISNEGIAILTLDAFFWVMLVFMLIIIITGVLNK